MINSFASRVLLSGLAIASLLAFDAPTTTDSAGPSHLADAFSPGWMLKDTNADGVVDFIEGKVVVPAHPSAIENAAAANVAARLGFGTTGLTPPLVVSAAEDPGSGARIWIGKDAVGRAFASRLTAYAKRLQEGEGGVFAIAGNLAIVGYDDAGLSAAANAFSSRSPYIWKVPGAQINAIAQQLNGAKVRIVGLTYIKGKAGINKVLLESDGSLQAAALKTALNSPHLAAVHELVAIGGAQDVTATNAKPLPALTTGSPVPASTPATPSAPVSGPTAPAAGSTAGAGSAAAPQGSRESNVSTPGADTTPAASPESETATPSPLDLSTLYTSHGLFKGAPKMPIPSALDGQLYVPAGPEGVAMANLAARMGLETTGLSLPLATAAPDVKPKEIRTKSVLPETSPVGTEASKKLETGDTASKEAEQPLSAGEGELRIVDHAFGKNAAVLVRGDEQGSIAALQVLTDRFPNVWEPGKQYQSLEELRYDLHRFFSLRSSSGQTTAALYHLNRWMAEIKNSSPGPLKDVKAEMYVDVADPKLAEFVRKQVEAGLNTTSVDVKVGDLHAGTHCCAANPELHYEQPGITFEQAAPTFQEDVTIPWEGARLLNLVKDAAHGIKGKDTVTLVARVSEGPEERQKIRKQLLEILAQRGVAADKADVEVLCAFKQGYSWLLDEVAPKLEGKGVASIKIDFAKDLDPTGVRVMYSPARWVQELYPVDEMLAKKLNVPLQSISLNEFEPTAGSPIYRVHAYDAAGKECFTSDFTPSTVMRPYNGVMPRYEQVQVETGWVRLQAGSRVVLDQRIKTDIEEFWEHYQDQTLPKVYQFVMSQAKGDLKPEFAPAFDTLRLDIHLSEPNYSIGLDKERISSLEALQEDTFYSTENFVNMMGDLEAGRPENYVGRIIPVVHGSEDGQDGHVHIEFYGKAAANPLVRLSWTDAQGQRHEKERDLPVLTGPMEPRLIRARVKAGESGLDDLMWLLAADYAKDDFEEWIKLEPQEQVERSIFSVEQAKAQIDMLGQLHKSGLYRDEIAYPHVQHLSFEFELPVPLSSKAESPAPRSFVSWDVEPPATPRPMIGDYANKLNRSPIVQWDEPISPDENTAILAQFAKHPGVNVYWMGRSYLGRNIWAADFMVPTPAQSTSTLISWAKETTLKASIIYSGRQHANEVSSTSHVDKLGEQLVSDAQTQALLKQVNVILHPIDNPDGAQLSVELAKITPDNLLHPGYHGALAADVAMGQPESDPVYPESRTRRQLLESWLPDGFLNPHGYPSHEWVQPFSEYTGWVQSREGANPGRAWWIPRGWFTSLTYLRDSEHPYSEKVTYELRDRIVEAERNVPGLLDLETRMNDRYERFGQRWQPKDMTQPIVKGIRIYMALKGTPAPRPGAGQARSGAATGGVSPDVTWDAGYTEAPDETAHGDYMKLMASAGLAFDRVHLTYLANGKLRIRRVQHEAGDKVSWQVLRDRPNLPASELEPAKQVHSE